MNAELVADLVGDYLFTDSEFLKSLSAEKPRLFQKLWNEVKYLCRTVTAKSLEAKKLLEVEKRFKEAYKDTKKASESGVNSVIIDEKQKYSITFDSISNESAQNAKSRGDIVLNNEIEILDAIERSLNDRNLKENYIISSIPNDVKEHISNDTRPDIFKNGEYVFKISSDDIRHIEKHFKTSDDMLKAIYRLYDVVCNYDTVSLVENSQNRLKFEKRYQDYDYLSIEIASKKTRCLDLVTFYITKNNQKNKGGIHSPADSNESARRGVPSSNDSISQNSDNVNSKFSLSPGDADYAPIRGDLKISGDEIRLPDDTPIRSDIGTNNAKGGTDNAKGGTDNAKGGMDNDLGDVPIRADVTKVESGDQVELGDIPIREDISQPLTGDDIAPPRGETLEGKVAEAAEAVENQSLQEKFRQEYDTWDKADPRKSFTVGKTSNVLRRLGVKDTKIKWDASKIIKIKSKHAEMTDEIIKQVPKIIDDPIVVFKSMQSESRMTLFGEVYAGDKPILAVLELDPTGRNGVSLNDIKIASAYGKDNAQGFIDRSELLYVDSNEKRISEWEKRTGLQLPVGSSQADPTGRANRQNGLSGSVDDRIVNASSNDIIPNAEQNVKGNSENVSESKSGFDKPFENAVNRARLEGLRAEYDALNQEGLKALESGDEAKVDEVTERLGEIEKQISDMETRIAETEAEIEAEKKAKEAAKTVTKKSEKEKAAEKINKIKESARIKVENAKKDAKDRIDKYREDRERTQNKKELLREIGRLQTKLFKSTKEKHIHYTMEPAVAEAMSKLNLEPQAVERLLKYYDELEKLYKADVKDEAKIAELQEKCVKLEEKAIRLKESMNNLLEAYKSFADSKDSIARDAFDADLSEKLDGFVKEIGDTPVYKLSGAQMKSARQFYAMLLHRVNNANKMYAGEYQQTVDEMAYHTMEEVKAAKIAKFMKNVKRAVKLTVKSREFLINDLKPPHFFELLSSPTLLDLYEGLHRGELVWAQDIDETADFLKKTAGMYHFHDWDKKATKEYTSANGHKFELTVGQAMYIYALSKRQTDSFIENKTPGRKHLEYGGFKFKPDTKIEGEALTKYLNDATRYTLGDGEIAAIINSLTAEQRAFADALQKYMSENLAEKGNEVSRKLYGTDLFTEKNYITITSSNEYLDSATGKQGDPKIKNKGMTKPLTVDANNPIILEGIEDVFTRHAHDMALYHGMVLPIEDINRVLNFATSSKLEAAIADSAIDLSKSIYEYPYNIQTVIKDYIGSTDKRILSFIDEHLNGETKKFGRQNISKVTEKQAKEIKKLLGVDVSDFTNAINTNAVNHIRKRHGENGVADHSMQNEEDIARVGYILENFDSVEIAKHGEDGVNSSEFMNSDNTPSPMLIFKKKINGTYYVAQAVPDSSYKKLWVVSAYINKKGAVTQVLDTNKTVGMSLPSPTPDNIIHQDGEIVNSNTSFGRNQSGTLKGDGEIGDIPIREDVPDVKNAETEDEYYRGDAPPEGKTRAESGELSRPNHGRAVYVIRLKSGM